ncbi:hypothetical protein [Hydrocarboniphaga sp.]|uniref:hypothetical protein n=1 Tax=Hydrocarboniphaga sp. TaxID=2033016 RepID=UPI003D0BA7BA
MTRVFPLLAALLLPFAASAADPYAELRAYPTGGIASVGAWFPQGDRWDLGVSAVYDRAERGDAGRHDDESGDGFGIGIEARRSAGTAHPRWFYGVRAELLRLSIDWRDDDGARGNSEVTVLQPTARVGYRLPLGSTQWDVEAAASLGAEINISTSGEAVGEGAIVLLGMAVRPH